MRYRQEPPADIHGLWITMLTILAIAIGSVLVSVFL